MLWVGGRDDNLGRRSKGKSLRREKDIDVERVGFGGGASLVPGLRPKFGRQSQRLIGERKIAP